MRRAVNQNGKVFDFRLTARHEAKAARIFFRQAQNSVRIYSPMSITTDKAPTYKRILTEVTEYGFPGEEIIHFDNKCQNNRIESDPAALKRLTDPGQRFHSLRTAKATLKGIEAIRMIKRGHVYDPPSGVTGEIYLLNGMFGIAAKTASQGTLPCCIKELMQRSRFLRRSFSVGWVEPSPRRLGPLDWGVSWERQ